jgi:CRISPR-associated protein Cas2
MDVQVAHMLQWIRGEVSEYRPVQYSVFECHVDAGQLAELRQHLARLVRPGEDSLRYYRLCKDCLEQTVIIGERPLRGDPDHRIA